jgi:hypothetical protein
MITQYAITYEPRLFIALLGRAPDGVNFANYAYAFEANQPLDAIASWMYYDYQPSEYPASMSHAQIAAKFYANIHGHAPTQAQIAPWVARLDAWESPSSVMVDMIAALVDYTGTDAATLQSQALFNNKVAVALYYASYGGDELGVSAVLQPVTADPDSVIEAIHAMKGHYNIPADAPDPDPTTPAPVPAPGPDPVVKDGLPEHAMELAQLYLAYFGRPMDWDGIDFYASHDGPLDLFALARGFSESPESQQLYGTTFGASQVNAIYQNLFNRNAEAAGIAYWTGEVNAGHLTAAGAALGILLGAQNSDRIAVQNKLQVSLAFSEHVDTQSEVAGYSGAQAAASARAFLHTVGWNGASVTTAMAQLDAQVAAAVHAGAGASAQPAEAQLVGVAPQPDPAA